MAIPRGANDIKISRRHLARCRRYADVTKKPFTYEPTAQLARLTVLEFAARLRS